MEFGPLGDEAEDAMDLEILQVLLQFKTVFTKVFLENKPKA
jgi:hypothetical protein